MPDMKLAKKTWALGLVLTLLTFNMAYVKASVNEVRSAPATNLRTVKLNEDSSTKPLDSNSTKATVTSDKKKSSPGKPLAKAVKDCACACPAPTSRSAANAGRWWDCTRRCLVSMGVSPVQLLICAGVCAAGVVPACIVCLAVDISVFMFCSLACSAYASNHDSDSDGYEIILARKALIKKKRNGERRMPLIAARR